MSDNYGPKIVTDGLLMYVDAANSKSYPGSGSTWFDLSGNSNDGTNYNLDYSSDNNGSLVYNASGDRTVISGNITSGMSSISMCAWFKMTGGSGYRCVIHKGTTASVGSSQYWTGFQTSGNVVSTIGARELDASYLSGDTLVPGVLGTWYNTTSTWDGSSVNVYLDGVWKVQYNLANLTHIDYPTRLGACSDTGGYQVIGNIAASLIYGDKVLSSNEVKQNYAALKGRFE